MSDWQTALAEARDMIAGRIVRGGDTWVTEPAGDGAATVGLFVGDGTLRVVFARDAGDPRWRVVGGSVLPVFTWRHLIAACLVQYGYESPLSLRSVGSWCST